MSDAPWAGRESVGLRGARIEPTLWTTATLAGARVDIAQPIAYAAAHGLRLDGESDG